MFGALLLALIVIGVLLVWLGDEQKKDHVERDILYEDFNVKYLGGLPNKEGGKKVTLTIKSDRVFLAGLKTIFKAEILGAEIQSEQQIVNNISLGKIVAFGLLSLGMQNTKTIVKNYVVIRFLEGNEERNIILECNGMERVVGLINALARQ